jgi:hypothetical protein
MDMPQKETFEHSNSMDFMGERINQRWNVVCLAPLTFFLEPTPTQGGNHISSTVH